MWLCFGLGSGKREGESVLSHCWVTCQLLAAQVLRWRFGDASPPRTTEGALWVPAFPRTPFPRKEASVSSGAS